MFILVSIQQAELEGAQHLLKSLFWDKTPFITTDTGCLAKNQTIGAYHGRASLHAEVILNTTRFGTPRGQDQDFKPQDACDHLYSLFF